MKVRARCFFGAVKQLEETYANADAHETLIIKLKDVSMIDLSGAYALEDLVKKARDEGKKVFLCSAPPHVMKVLQSVKVLDHAEQENYFEVIGDAIEMARELSNAPVVTCEAK